ncbi:MAG: zonular occludens toxin domain-containing protein [Opitutaceae bacterium]|jgi:hypothetical protein
MSLNLLDGLMGAGKTYIGVNFFILDELTNGDRHIYTTLPIKPEVIVCDLARGRPTRKRELLDRLHILENKDSPVFDAEGKPLMVPATKKPGSEMVPLVLNEIRCFWRFTKPNSVIILDECADWFNARDWKENANLGMEVNELQSYVNHHRHYKDDLYIICQNIDDIDKQIRTKFQHLYRVANSLKENMFEWKFLKGVKWPIQFFKVRVYHPRDIKHEDDSFVVWPRAAGFRRYDSFSASERIPGKAMPSKDAASSDYGQGYWKRMSLWLSRSWQLIMWLSFGLGSIGGVGWVVYGLIALDSNAVATVMTSKAPSVQVSPKEAARVLQAKSEKGAVVETTGGVRASSSEPLPSEIKKEPSSAKSEKESEKKEDSDSKPRVVLVTPGLFKTSDGKWYKKGEEYEGKRILHFDTDFIYCADGVLHRTGL